MHGWARKHELYRTRPGVSNSEFSPPSVANARNEILGLEGWEKTSRRPATAYLKSDTDMDTELQDRPPSIVLVDHSSTRDPIR